VARMTDRYASAITSSDLSVQANAMGDTDILAAFAVADRALSTGRLSDGTPIFRAPLAVPLERLLAGQRMAADVVAVLAHKLMGRAGKQRVKPFSRVLAHDMARAVLGWWIAGFCKACGGLGQTLIPGSRALSGHPCRSCRGEGRIPFENHFRHEHQELARWLICEIEHEASRAGPPARELVAPRD
jgi:hypothetical protein